MSAETDRHFDPPTRRQKIAAMATMPLLVAVVIGFLIPVERWEAAPLDGVYQTAGYPASGYRFIAHWTDTANAKRLHGGPGLWITAKGDTSVMRWEGPRPPGRFCIHLPPSNDQCIGLIVHQFADTITTSFQQPMRKVE